MSHCTESESPIGPSATTPCHGRRNLRRVERAVLRWLRGAVVRSVALPQGKACNNVDLLGQPTGYRWRFPKLAGAAMEFGILFTSQPHREREPYPHRAVHARVTDEIIAADRLGFDCAWLAEHHFSTEYGIMPDVWVYAGHLAALTKRIKLGMAVVTLPLANPVRTVENAGFVDILSGGRVVLGVGSGYRKYEFDGFGLEFEARREMQEEALQIVLDLLRQGRSTRK